MTLTYELDLDILQLDLHAKIQVCMSVRSAGIARRTDRHTNDVKTITPITSETWDVKIENMTCKLIIYQRKLQHILSTETICL